MIDLRNNMSRHGFNVFLLLQRVFDPFYNDFYFHYDLNLHLKIIYGINSKLSLLIVCIIKVNGIIKSYLKKKKRDVYCLNKNRSK